MFGAYQVQGRFFFFAVSESDGAYLVVLMKCA